MKNAVYADFAKQRNHAWAGILTISPREREMNHLLEKDSKDLTNGLEQADFKNALKI